MKQSRTRKVIAVTTIWAATFGAGTAAFAEGSWTSSISGAVTGFDSRNWTDKNNDSASTTIKFDTCRNVNLPATNVTDTDVQLRKNNNNWPDESKGTKNLACQSTATGNWGDVAAGTYYFRITKIDGSSSGGRLNVGSVKTSY